MKLLFRSDAVTAENLPGRNSLRHTTSYITEIRGSSVDGHLAVEPRTALRVPRLTGAVPVPHSASVLGRRLLRHGLAWLAGSVGRFRVETGTATPQPRFENRRLGEPNKALCLRKGPLRFSSTMPRGWWTWLRRFDHCE